MNPPFRTSKLSWTTKTPSSPPATTDENPLLAPADHDDDTRPDHFPSAPAIIWPLDGV